MPPRSKARPLGSGTTDVESKAPPMFNGRVVLRCIASLIDSLRLKIACRFALSGKLEKVAWFASVSLACRADAMSSCH